MAALPALATREGTPWQLRGWAYRRPVQVFNASNIDKTGLIVALNDFPFLTLMNDGKLATDACDLRLVDADEKNVPLRADYLLDDSGHARLAFYVKEVGKGERKFFWLYYGNPRAKPGPLLDATDDMEFFENVGATCGAEEGLTPERAADDGAQLRWIAPYHLTEAEKGKLEGTAAVAQVAGVAGRQVSGAALVAFNDTGHGSITLEVDTEAGETNCWVRYCPSTMNKATHGQLTVSIRQGDKASVEKTVDLRSHETAAADDPGDLFDVMKPVLNDDARQDIERTSYRWLSLRLPFTAGKATLVITGEKTLAGVDCVLLTKDLQYLPDVRDFQNRIWVRWRYQGPAGSRYFTNVNSQTWYDFHGAHWEPTGDVGFFGLNPVMKNPLDRLDGDYIDNGEYSSWALLPTSTYDTWYSQLTVYVPPGQNYLYEATKTDLQFATRPSINHVFHLTMGETADSGPVVRVRMPTDLSWKGVNKIESFGEWAQRRLAIVKDLKLGPPPRLKRLRIGDWAFTGTPDSGMDRIENEYGIQDNLGFNMVFGSYFPDAVFEKLAKEHGLIDINTIAWPYIPQTVPGTWKGDSDLDKWLDTHVTQLYRDFVTSYKQGSPYVASITTRFNMGDEIGDVVDAKGILASPPILADFRDFLKKRDLTPQSFGMEKWEDVNPTDDVKLLGKAGPVRQAWDIDLPPDDPDPDQKNPGLVDEGPKFPSAKSLAAARLFYYTRRYMDDYTAHFFKLGTDVILQAFPKARIISPNYQAAPMQSANLNMDIFHFARTRAFIGLQIEDWVGANDSGCGRVALGTELMRAAARKFKDNYCGLQVGGESIKHEMFTYVMHGAKDVDSYLYGPLQNIGPSWGEYKESNAAVAQFTREVKPFDEAIGDGDIRPRKAAMLVSYTADVMQVRGFNHDALRQSTYMALEQSYVSVDAVGEQEILEDDILKNYSLLYITDPQAPVAVQRKIAEWVKNGGHLWLGAGALNWDEFNQPCSIFNEVCGVLKRDLQDHVASDVPSTTLTVDSPLFGGKVTLPVYGETLDIQPTTAKVLGSYADGEPAVTLNSYGKGEAMLVGAMVGNSYYNAHFKTNILDPNWQFELGAEAQKLLGGLVESMKFEKPVTLSIPGIYTSVWDTPRGTMVFLNNATYSALWGVKDRRPAPRVTARIRVPGPIKSVQSMNGELQFTQVGNEVTVQLALPDTDILLLK